MCIQLQQKAASKRSFKETTNPRLNYNHCISVYVMQNIRLVSQNPTNEDEVWKDLTNGSLGGPNSTAHSSRKLKTTWFWHIFGYEYYKSLKGVELNSKWGNFKCLSLLFTILTTDYIAVWLSSKGYWNWKHKRRRHNLVYNQFGPILYSHHMCTSRLLVPT